MHNKHKGRSCKTRPISSFIQNIIDTLKCNELINLMQGLRDECHNPRANSENIIGDFYKKTNQMRRKWR